MSFNGIVEIQEVELFIKVTFQSHLRRRRSAIVYCDSCHNSPALLEIAINTVRHFISDRTLFAESLRQQGLARPEEADIYPFFHAVLPDFFWWPHLSCPPRRLAGWSMVYYGRVLCRVTWPNQWRLRRFNVDKDSCFPARESTCSLTYSLLL